MSASESGLYSPDDWMWRVNREAVLLLAGPRALLMQVAHPLVAAGVADHSHFQAHPLARLRGTLDAMLGMIFGSHDEGRAHAERVNAVHEHVRGTLPLDTPAFAAGTPYSALDPKLLFWVQATLIDSALCAYECFVAPLDASAKRELYEESKRMAPLLRLPVESLPRDYDAFRAELDAILCSDTLFVTADGRAIADAVLHPRGLPIPRALFTGGAVVPLGLLPERLRRAYGFAWTHRHERAFRAARASIRALLPVLPDRVRLMPRAYRAQRERRAEPHSTEASQRARSR